MGVGFQKLDSVFKSYNSGEGGGGGGEIKNPGVGDRV